MVKWQNQPPSPTGYATNRGFRTLFSTALEEKIMQCPAGNEFISGWRAPLAVLRILKILICILLYLLKIDHLYSVFHF